MKALFLIVIIAFFACNQPSKKPVVKALQPITIPNKTISNTDSLLKLQNGIYKFNGQIFSGYIQTNFPNKKIQIHQSIYQGKSEGWTNEFFENGNKLSTRYYHLGEKDSVHTGWWINGNLRFIYHFSNGNYNGNFEEFYNSGKLLKKILYSNGKDSCGIGWRENGKPFMNYVMKDDRRYGLMNAQLCYTLKKERGEYKK